MTYKINGSRTFVLKKVASSITVFDNNDFSAH